jgi:hypothetical protein
LLERTRRSRLCFNSCVIGGAPLSVTFGGETYTVSFQSKRFITLTLGDRESWGYNEETLPMLLRLVDSSSPDYRMFTHTGVVANYLTSRRALRMVEDAIAKAERLSETDPRFATLGIGLAEGELLAELDWRGRLKSGSDRPLGPSLTDAVRVEREPQKYREVLQTLHYRVDGPVAEPDASPNGSPTERLGNSGVGDGPPSVS